MKSLQWKQIVSWLYLPPKNLKEKTPTTLNIEDLRKRWSFSVNIWKCVLYVLRSFVKHVTCLIHTVLHTPFFFSLLKMYFYFRFNLSTKLNWIAPCVNIAVIRFLHTDMYCNVPTKLLWRIWKKFCNKIWWKSSVVFQQLSINSVRKVIGYNIVQRTNGTTVL